MLLAREQLVQNNCFCSAGFPVGICYTSKITFPADFYRFILPDSQFSPLNGHLSEHGQSIDSETNGFSFPNGVKGHQIHPGRHFPDIPRFRIRPRPGGDRVFFL